MKLSVVIPARNEADNISTTLDAVRQRLVHEGIEYELVIVDDGSTDTTPQQVQACSATDSGIILVRNTGQHGFGLAVRCGLDVCTGDAVVIAMADASEAPDDIVKYYYILRDTAECAFGSRFIKGSAVENYPPLKRCLNRLGNLGIRLLFGMQYNDITNAFKGYRAYVIAGCRPLLARHFNLTVELPLKAMLRGYSYAIVPISWYNRKQGFSSFRMTELGSRYLYSVLHVWLEKKLTHGNDCRSDAEGVRRWPPHTTDDRSTCPADLGSQRATDKYQKT